MQIDWWTLGFQTINVLILIWLLGRFLFRPVADAIAARQAEEARRLADAEAASKRAHDDEDKARSELERIAASRGEILKAASAAWEVERETLLSKARTEANELRTEAQVEIAQQRELGAREANDYASRLAIDIAGKLLDKLPESARTTPFIGGLVQGVADLPPATRLSLGTRRPALLIRTAGPLTADDEDRLNQELGSVLGLPVKIMTEVEPALIAGLEVEDTSATVKNSFRADLTRLVTELTRHDPSA